MTEISKSKKIEMMLQIAPAVINQRAEFYLHFAKQFPDPNADFINIEKAVANGCLRIVNAIIEVAKKEDFDKKSIDAKITQAIKKASIKK